MNINSTYKLLEELGLKISDYKIFGEFVRNNNNSYEEAIDKIRKAKSVKDKKINYTDFEKRMVGYFKEIQRLINKDSLFVFSNEEDKDNFKKYFQSIIDKYIIIYKLKDDKDNCKKKADEIVELKNEIDKINNNYVSLTPDEIEQINDLKFNLDIKNMEYRKLLSSIEETNKVITKYSNKNEFVKLIWMISRDVSKLSELMNRLSITNETRNDLTKILDEVSKYFESVEIECIDDINNFINICKSAGIISKDKIDNVSIVNMPVGNDAKDNVSKKDVEISKDATKEEKNIPTLEVGDLVTYNNFLDYEGYNYEGKLKPNVVYKVSYVFFDNKGTEMFYLEGIDLPFPATIFDLVPGKDNEIEQKSNIISNSDLNHKEFDLKETYIKALEGLRTKKISSYIKNAIAKISEKYYIDENEEEMNLDNYSPDELLNLEEFSKIYNEVKSGRRR